jgi:hypothetical protein
MSSEDPLDDANMDVSSTTPLILSELQVNRFMPTTLPVAVATTALPGWGVVDGVTSNADSLMERELSMFTPVANFKLGTVVTTRAAAELAAAAFADGAICTDGFVINAPVIGSLDSDIFTLPATNEIHLTNQRELFAVMAIAIYLVAKHGRI